MPSRYELKNSKNNQYYWTLQGNNNEILLKSETYPLKASAVKGIASAKVNSPHDSRYQRSTASNGQYYFTLRAENYEKLGTSEMYTTVSGRDNGIEACKKVGPGAPVVDLTTQTAGTYR
jgi:uncharacterized protein YegP (UPF0339 family)